jgi:penicillin amidase
VLFDGERGRPFIEKEFAFDERGRTNKTEMKTFRWVPAPRPIVSEDLAAGTAISVRWRGHEGGAAISTRSSGSRRPPTWRRRRRRWRTRRAPARTSSSWTRPGDIGWYPYSKLPKRAWASKELPPWLPLPGDGTAEWDGFVPFERAAAGSRNPPPGVHRHRERRT